MKKHEIIKILNIVEPILCLLMGICAIWTIIFALNNINWINLGGKLRDWYWYESLIKNITMLLPIVIIIFELYIFFNVKNNYKLYTLVYLVVDVVVSFLVWTIHPFIIFVSIFLFNLVKCVYRIIYMNKILKL